MSAGEGDRLTPAARPTDESEPSRAGKQQVRAPAARPSTEGEPGEELTGVDGGCATGGRPDDASLLLLLLIALVARRER